MPDPDVALNDKRGYRDDIEELTLANTGFRSTRPRNRRSGITTMTNMTASRRSS